MDTPAPVGLSLLREPFPAHQISYIPKGGIKLAYVGHAALTDRLLDADPGWTWEPLAIINGLPVLDPLGGMWIKLTVCGVTRLGYGHAGNKEGGDAIKEVIGDALRNAAMRFGAALDLWHKGTLHIEEEEKKPDVKDAKKEARESELQELALYLIDCERQEKQLDAIRLWYAADTWAADSSDQNDEKTYVWGLLKHESKLRSAIKANKPEVAA
jgi:hypothetical protein